MIQITTQDYFNFFVFIPTMVSRGVPLLTMYLPSVATFSKRRHRLDITPSNVDWPAAT